MRRRVQAQGSALGSYIGELFLRPEGAQGIFAPSGRAQLNNYTRGVAPG